MDGTMSLQIRTLFKYGEALSLSLSNSAPNFPIFFRPWFVLFWRLHLLNLQQWSLLLKIINRLVLNILWRHRPEFKSSPDFHTIMSHFTSLYINLYWEMKSSFTNLEAMFWKSSQACTQNLIFIYLVLILSNVYLVWF